METEDEIRDFFAIEIAPGVIAQWGETDKPAMRQAFNDWIDCLHKDGAINDEMADTICLGEYVAHRDGIEYV